MSNHSQARRDRQLMEEFMRDVKVLWELEDETTRQLGPSGVGRRRTRYYDEAASEKQRAEYAKTRTAIARRMVAVSRLALGTGAAVVVESAPAPMVGGMVIRQNMVEAVLNDYTHGGLSRREIWDGLNQALGVLEERERRERRKMLNPLHWVVLGLTWVLRIPFMLVSATGFDVGKVEDHVIGKAIKVVELVVIAYLLGQSPVGDGVAGLLLPGSDSAAQTGEHPLGAQE